MRILLVHSLDDAQSVTRPLASLEDIQMGISYVSAVLKQGGHLTQLVVLSPQKARAGRRLMTRAVETFHPRIIGFTAVFSQYAFMAGMARRVKARRPDVFLVIGGPHASLNPAAVLADAFDAVCVGEGEQPMLELANRIEQGQSPSGLAGLWLKRPDGALEENAACDFRDNLDELPFPDRDMWLPWLREKVGARLSVLLGRGCPFQCTYCCNHALARLASGRYVRLRSPENILQEIRFLSERYPAKRTIYLEIETITLNRRWLLELCGRLAAFNAALPAPIAYGCNFRITTQSLDEEIFKALGQANFVSLNIGLESGSERIRREVLQRDYTNEQVLRAAALARRYGLRINLYNLIGIPGETEADHMQTVRLTRQVDPDRVIKSIFFPYPGTQLWEVCRQQGLLPPKLDVVQERRHAVLDLPGFPRRRIQHAYTWFEYRAFKGRRPLLGLLVRTLRNKVKASPLADAVYLKVVQVPFFDRLRAKGETSVNALAGGAS